MNKKLVMSILFCLISIALIASSSEAAPLVKVQAQQLLEDFDGDQIYKPFLIKGIGYSPTPIGRYPSDWGYQNQSDPRPKNIFDDPAILNRDFQLLSVMNANTIRLWKANDTQVTIADTQNTRSPWYQQWSSTGRMTSHLTDRTLKLAEQYKLKVIAGFEMPWPGTWDCPTDATAAVYNRQVDYTDPYVRQDLLTRFGAFVKKFKDSPAVLFWAIGNENNLGFKHDDITQIRAYYILVNEMAGLAHSIEGTSAHPVAVVNGEIKDINNPSFETADYQMYNLDIWGVNVYRGESFTNLFSDYSTKSKKPLWISEFGIDAWHSTDVNQPTKGHLDETTQSQWVGKLWTEIEQNSNVSIGGTVMEYSDEWWKPYEWQCGTNSNYCNWTHGYNGYGPRDQSCPLDGIIEPETIPASPDKYLNEEWFGVMSVKANPTQLNGPDVMTPRAVYTTLQNKFVSEDLEPDSDQAQITISSDNGFELYFNGVFLGSGSNWMQSQTFNVNVLDGKNVISVKAIDAGGAAAMIAEIIQKDQRIGTNARWKVSADFLAGWETMSFNDSSWKTANEYGSYGADPWHKQVKGFPTDTPARWIWNSDFYNQDVVYFRYTFSKGEVPLDKIIISADNTYELYLNGQQIGTGSSWGQSQNYDINFLPGKNVVAVKATDTGWIAGLLAEIWQKNQRIGTNSQWKISTTAVQGWEGMNFDDSFWKPANDYGSYGIEPWYKGVIGFPSDTPAHWIWSADQFSDDIIYGRFTFINN